ncbi:ice-binding family protein [Alkalibacter saccharofermentans]|nr:ice-binding family protein [Alkalibacter saccharofermentans]
MNLRKSFGSTSLILALSLILLLMPASVVASEPTVGLGTTESFAVLAGTTITNTGSTVISGDAGGNIGVSPGSSVTGFPPGTVQDGTIHLNDAEAIQAQADLVTAYNDAAGRPVTSDMTGQDLGGMTLTPGVYFFSSSAQLTGTLTLDAQGDPEAVFIFQIGSTLTTASNSRVSLINGAQYCRVFWQVGSSATLGTSTEFVGHIFALTDITANTNATVQGQLLARNGAVTLDSNTITNGTCTDVPPSSETNGSDDTETEPGTNGSDDTETEPGTNGSDDTETEPEANGSDTSATTTDTTTKDQQEIPKTGENINYVIVGLVLLGLAFGLTFIRHRSRQI